MREEVTFEGWVRLVCMGNKCGKGRAGRGHLGRQVTGRRGKVLLLLGHGCTEGKGEEEMGKGGLCGKSAATSKVRVYDISATSLGSLRVGPSGAFPSTPEE